jgi:hypothetical protein
MKPYRPSANSFDRPQPPTQKLHKRLAGAEPRGPAFGTEGIAVQAPRESDHLLSARVSRPSCHRARRFWRLVPVLLLISALPSAFGQVIPSLRMPPSISVFTTFTTVKPDFNYYGDLAVYGASVGGIFQTPHLFGVEVRGSFARSGGLEHQESALAGPRIQVRLKRFSPYLSLLGGAGNAWWWSNPPIKGEPTPKVIEGLGPQWSVVGGLGVTMNRRISFRVGELSYSKIYTKDRTLTPLTGSVGVVFRIN